MRYRTVIFILLMFLAVPVTQAQSIEYTIPTEYHLVPGQLSVTFGDTVSVETARAIVFSEGFTVAEYNFQPVQMTLVSDEELSSDLRTALQRHPDILGVRQVDLKEVFSNAPLPEDLARFQIKLSLVPTLTEQQARRLAAEVLPFYSLDSLSKRSNELVIVVDEGLEDRAMETLEGHSKVKYVAYVNAE